MNLNDIYHTPLWYLDSWRRFEVWIMRKSAVCRTIHRVLTNSLIGFDIVYKCIFKETVNLPEKYEDQRSRHAPLEV